MQEKDKKRRITKIAIFITSIFIICISISYALLNQTLTGAKRQVITSGNLSLSITQEENNLNLTNALPMYDEVGMIQTPFTFNLTNNTAQSANYILRLKDVTGAGIQKLDTSLVKYGLTKDGVGIKDLLSNLTDNIIDSGTITGNQTISYELRLWIDSTIEDETQIKDKSLSYQIELESTQKIATIYPETASEVLSKNLGEECMTYDDGTDTFLVGRCSKNYIWYSGKLWRVVLKNNETGAVKMVTDNAITAIQYNSENQTNFENSYVDQWLQQEFLPTLHDYQDYLVIDSIWDATTNSFSAPTRPVGTTPVTRTVGLLNSYEYYTTYNQSDGLATISTGYLNNEVGWWLLTPYSSSNVWYVYNSGGLDDRDVSLNGFGIRPAVNLKEDIQITSGDGTIGNPYRLKSSSGKIVNGTTLLSTRHSGEYIKFNQELYRIVGIEGNLTKIAAIDKPGKLSVNRFHSVSNIASFKDAQIKLDLESYYQGLDENVQNMIEPNTTWYLGTVADGNSYKASICATVDANINVSTCTKTSVNTTANIGLPRMGEMFTSQMTRGTKANFWTLTPSSSFSVWFVNERSGFYHNTDSMSGYGARPSMYLKSNVVISKDNTGDGTYEHPYDIELG